MTSASARDAKEAKRSCQPSEPTSKPRPILSVEFTEEIPLVKFYVGKLKDKRTTSKAIRMINAAAGSDVGLVHLKRCDGNRILLSPASNTSADELKATLLSGGFDLSLIDDELELLNVPSRPSRTKFQAEKCSKIWPLNFHPDKRIESIISGDIFTGEQLHLVESFMRSTLDAARIVSKGNSECNGSALIVDPGSGRPLAIASSKLDEHPLWHASMLAVDLIARTQGGGAWDLTLEENTGSPKRGNQSKRRFSSDFPLCYPPSLRDVTFPEPRPLEIPSTKPGRNTNSDELAKTGQPYLCTNLWVFLTREPCPLCAMALLHSRASKIFYGVGASSGVLGTKALLHTTPGLNHRYQVWSGILEKECEAVYEEMKTRELKSD